MADTTVTVRQDGTGDYTTISSAEAAGNVSSGYYKIEIDDSGQYNENVLLEVSGTATSSNYVWLTVSEGNRHAGVHATSGHARLYSNSGYVLELKDPYARVEYLEIEGTSDDNALRLNENNCLVSRCIIKGTRVTAANSTGLDSFKGANHFVDNCLIYGFTRGVLNWNYPSTVKNVYFDHCTIVDNSNQSFPSKGLTNIRLSQSYGTSLTNNLYNTGLAGSNQPDIDVHGSSGTNLIAHSGSHNAWDTDTTNFASSTGSYTSSQDISSGGLTATTTTANAMIVTSLTSGSENFTPVKATGAGSNLLLGNGTNRQGSEPDPRQDFSTDIRGAARPTTAGKIDIGAFQITTAAGFKYWDGSAWADSTAVQYWNGSAWTDVTGIQYWNGSAWTDPS